MTELKPITEDNFIDAFNLKLAPGQEAFVSHPVRSLHRPMFTGTSVSRSEYTRKGKWSVTSW